VLLLEALNHNADTDSLGPLGSLVGGDAVGDPRLGGELLLPPDEYIADVCENIWPAIVGSDVANFVSIKMKKFSGSA
jgi:hypothetical protein